MKLRTKIYVPILLIFLFVFLAVFILADTVLLRSYKELERTEIQGNVQQVHQTFENEILNLASLTRDWASWDDSHAFMAGENPEYINSNLVDGTFEELSLNLIIFFDTQGNVFYEKGYDLDQSKMIPVDGELRKQLLSDWETFNFSSIDSGVSGIITTDSQPLMVAWFPILTSLDEGPIRGSLLFGKYIDEGFMSFIQSPLSSSISLDPYQSSSLEGLSFIETGHLSYYLDESDRSTATYYWILQDVHHEAAYLVKQESERSIYQQGLMSIYQLLLTIIGTGILTSVIVILILERGVLNRITALSDAIQSFSVHEAEHKKFELENPDELGELSRVTHETLHALMEARDNLRGHLEMEELMVQISTEFINLPYQDMDKAILQILETIGNYIDADHSRIVLLRENDTSRLDTMFEWCQKGIQPIQDEFHNLPLKDFRWLINRTKTEESIFITSVDEIPKSAQKAKERLIHHDIQSFVTVPLLVAGQSIGFLSVDSARDKQSWGTETLTFMGITGNILSNALDRQRSETHLRLSQHYQYQLNEITKSGIEKEGFHQSMRTLSRHICTLIDCDEGYILFKHKDKNVIFQNGNQLDDENSLLQAVDYLAEKTKRGVFILNPGNEIKQDFFLNLRSIGESFIAIPLSVKNKHMGLAILVFHKDHTFSPLEIAICEQAGPPITLILLKSIALEESERYSQELDVLRATVADITSELELPKLLDTILERAISLLEADGGDVCIYDAENNHLRVVTSRNIPCDSIGTIVHIGEGAAGLAALNRETVILDDYSMWSGKMKIFENAGIHASLISPISIGERLIGTITIFHFDPKKRFNEDDRRLLSMFAQHAANAMDNAMLFEKIQKMARTDPVTGLLNRRALLEMGKSEVLRSQRLNHPISVIMVDLDNFKPINDQFSHLAGDIALREIATVMQKNLRNIDIIGRYGGDEFIILLPEARQYEAKAACERLRSQIKDTEININEEKVSFTASIGYVSHDENPPNLEKMINQADQAMYESKKSGKNRIAYFEE